jgi:hypothetical protein
MLTLGGIEFRNENKVLNYLKTIQTQTVNGAPVNTQYNKILTDVIHLHPDWEEKYSLYNHTGFTVNQHPEAPETRSFFLVKPDGTTEPFSLNQCLTNLKKTDK